LGAEQANTYKINLKKCIDSLAKGTGVYKVLNNIHPDLRLMLCQHHFIFVLPRKNSPAVVLAVLHERMDVMERLKERLTL
jgi:toxin ParE1/3/4